MSSTCFEEQKARANDMTTNRSMAGKATSQPTPETKKVGRRGKLAMKDLDLNPTTPVEAAKERIMRGLPPSPTGDVKVGGVTPKPVQQAGEDGEGGKPMAPSFGGIEKGQSTLGEALPDDVKFGDFTALNTDRHLYYSFYARMEEKIRFRWVTYARAAIFSVPPATLRQSGKENYVTQLEILLDPKGKFHSRHFAFGLGPARPRRCTGAGVSRCSSLPKSAAGDGEIRRLDPHLLRFQRQHGTCQLRGQLNLITQLTARISLLDPSAYARLATLITHETEHVLFVLFFRGLAESPYESLSEPLRDSRRRLRRARASSRSAPSASYRKTNIDVDA